MQIQILLLLPLLLASAGCRTGNDTGSETLQLKDQLSSFKCTSHPERLAAVTTKYGPFLQGSNAAWRAHALDVLTNLPEEYLAWVFTKHQVPVILSNISGGVTDLVINGGNPPDRPAFPTKIRVSPGQPHYFPLQHEMGHAMQPRPDETHKTFYQSFKYWFKQAAGSSTPESAAMWSYPKTAVEEYWAELFDSYYCSAEARQHMATTYPRSYQFARRYLISPDQLDLDFKTTPAYKVEKEPAGDEDADGIKNAADLCSDTLPGLAVWATGQFLGCAAGQHPDQIHVFLSQAG